MKKLSLIWVITLSVSVITGDGLSILSCNKTDEVPTVTQCFKSCSDTILGEQVKVSILSQEDPTSIVVGRCIWRIMKQSFTETWTFSRLISAKEITWKPATTQECNGAFHNLCKNKAGCVSEDLEIEPEFSWARTEIREVKHLSIETLTVSAYLHQGAGKVLIDGVAVPISKKTHNNGDYTYVWDEVPISEVCPWKHPISHLSCYKDKEDLDDIYCPSQGISLVNYTKVDTSCPEQVYTDIGGLVFKLGKVDFNDWYPYVIESSDVAVKETISSINMALKMRESVHCHQDCLEIRRRVTYVDGFYYDPLPPAKCRLIGNCSVDSGSVTCNNGTLVWATCGGRRVWIDLKSGRDVKNAVCEKGGRSRISKNQFEGVLNEFHLNNSKFGNILRANEIHSVILKDNEVMDFARVVKSASERSGNFSEGTLINVRQLFRPMINFLRGIEHEIKVVAFSVLALIVGYIIIRIRTVTVAKAKSFESIAMI